MRISALLMSLFLLPSGAFGQNPSTPAPPGLSRLTLTLSGSGEFSPNLDDHLLKIGATYKITARPGRGFVFSNWTGAVASSSPQLLFIMRSNLALHANFVTNPFPPVKGTYAGLFYDSSSLSFDRSGFLTLTLGDQGSCSARLQSAGRSYSFHGQFSAAGACSNSVPRRGLSPLTVQLQLDWGGGDQLAGTIGDGLFTAQVTAHRATYSKLANPAPQGGKQFTLVISSAAYSPLQPSGHGFGRLTVDPAGKIHFAGTLGDGTKASQAAFLSKTGTWPFFATLYGGRGSILGELHFAPESASDLAGPIHWYKLAQPRSRYYPTGFAFTNGLEAVGSAYSFTRGVPLLTLTNGGVVLLEGGDLAEIITNVFTLDLNNRVTGPNKLSVSITPSTGLFHGRVINPATSRPITINGVLLLKQNAGFGQFLSTNQSGPVYFGPREFPPIFPPPPPAADFSASPTSGVAPLAVTFLNLSRRATNYLWDFGDGSGSGLEQPTKTYTNAGAYSVSLTAMGPGGSDVRTRADYIVVTNETMVPGTNLPSRLLNLANWKLTLPVDTSHDGSPDEIKQPELDGFQNTNYFRVNESKTAVLFTAPCGGATTSGSSYPRCELREMTNGGRDTAAWSTTVGTHTMEIQEAILHLPVVKPHVVAGQIHDANDDVIVFRLEGTKLFIDENGNDGPVLTTSYQLGDVFTAKFVARNGGVDCYYNGQFIYTHPASASGCYFKAGCYTQSNSSKGDAPTAYGQVAIYDVSIKHE